ncbi:hypothetical protein [Pseudomonas oryzihabitans]|uniref:hypothetical protein n=1 Tax=Pseudomonas oryzihabitans TaxID=47885 RepID=UPI0028959373|nr:hypothetical protein [Pseudomonas oryzihabitans]MDT3722857.1 hypothetical protein [Pseudomonas oryzihabitans]
MSPFQNEDFGHHVTFGPTRSGASFYLTMVIRLPDHQKARAALAGDVEVLVDLHGGEITGRSLDDEMTLCERFEAALPRGEAEAIRKEHAAALPLPGNGERER